MKQIVYLSLTPERWAVASGTATPEQRKIAKKQRCFIVLEEPYYPTVGDMKEAINWLADRGFGKAPQTVPIESDQPTGYPVELRQWPPGIDPVAQGRRRHRPEGEGRARWLLERRAHRTTPLATTRPARHRLMADHNG